MRFVTAIAVSAGGDRPSHITHLRLRDGAGNSVWTRQQIVNWIDNGGQAKVANDYGPKVVPVHPTYNPDYVRSSPNDTPSDNLMALPRFIP